MYTKDFTFHLRENLQLFKHIQEKLNSSRKEFHVLEVGCFEGRGTNLLFQTFCRFHENSTITCVDPFLDTYTVQSVHFPSCDVFFKNQYSRFQKNVNSLGSQCKVVRGLSTDELPKLADETYDFIYIDGDHHKDVVYLDAINAFQKVKPNGIILFDDYLWQDHDNGPKEAIDQFLKEYKEQLKVLFIQYQVAVQKIVKA